MEISSEIEIFRARLKISSEPPTAALFFAGNSRCRDWNFRAGLKISIEIENFEWDWIFGPSGRGALRKFVANCAPNSMRKIGGISFVRLRWRVRKIVANLSRNFGQFYANTPFPMPLSPNFWNHCVQSCIDPGACGRSELFAMRPVQFSWPCGTGENRFTKTGISEALVEIFLGKI